MWQLIDKNGLIKTSDTSQGSGSYTATIGDGSSTSIVVTHNLGTRDCVVTTYDLSTFGEVDTEVEYTTTNTITLRFTNAPTASQFRVLIQSSTPGTAASLTSPAFLGVPTAPTAAANTNTTQIATTAFVLGQGVQKATTVGALTAFDGAQATLRLGASPYEFVPLVYDTTYGKWVSAEKSAFFGTDGLNNITRANFAAGAGVFAATIEDADFAAKVTAGLTPQARLVGWLTTNGTNPTTQQLQMILRFRHIGNNAEDGVEFGTYSHSLLTQTTSNVEHGIDTSWQSVTNPGSPKSILYVNAHFINNESVAVNLQWSLTMKLRWTS